MMYIHDEGFPYMQTSAGLAERRGHSNRHDLSDLISCFMVLKEQQEIVWWI